MTRVLFHYNFPCSVGTKYLLTDFPLAVNISVVFPRNNAYKCFRHGDINLN